MFRALRGVAASLLLAATFLATVAGAAHAASVNDSYLTVSTPVTSILVGEQYSVSATWKNTSGSTVTDRITVYIQFPASSNPSRWTLSSCSGSHTSCTTSGSDRIEIYNDTDFADNAQWTTTVIVNANSAGDLDVGGAWKIGSGSETSIGSTFSVPINDYADASVAIAPTASVITIPRTISYLVTVSVGSGSVTSASGTVTITFDSTRLTSVSGSCAVVSFVATCSYNATTTTPATFSFSAPVNLLALGTINAPAVLSAQTPVDLVSSNNSASTSCTAVSTLLVTCP